MILLSSTGFNVLSLRNKAGLLVSLCFLESVGCAGISCDTLESQGRERGGWCYKGQRQGGRGWVLANRHLHFSHLPSFPSRNPSTNLFHALFPLHPNRALWASHNFNDLDTPGSQWGHNPDSAWDPHNAPTSRCDCRAPSVTGEGIISLFSYLRGRTVLKPSQTDG